MAEGAARSPPFVAAVLAEQLVRELAQQEAPSLHSQDPGRVWLEGMTSEGMTFEGMTSEGTMSEGRTWKGTSEGKTLESTSTAGRWSVQEQQAVCCIHRLGSSGYQGRLESSGYCKWSWSSLQLSLMPAAVVAERQQQHRHLDPSHRRPSVRFGQQCRTRRCLIRYSLDSWWSKQLGRQLAAVGSLHRQRRRRPPAVELAKPGPAVGRPGNSLQKRRRRHDTEWRFGSK